ncbi:LrgB family protein, partial [Micrococcus endophyticus]
MNAAELTDSLAEAWDALLHTPLFGIALTLAVAVLARRLWLAARQTALLTPVLVTIVLVAAFLALTGIDYETYMIGGSYLTFLLGPATVALAVPLYRAGPDIRKLLLPIAVGVTVGSLTAMVSAVLIVRLMGGNAALAATFAPKSATTPIAMAVAD